MSLINDALKKAARQRAQEDIDLAPLMPGASRGQPSRDGKRNRTQTYVLVGAAAVALIVVSVVLTGILVTGKPDTPAPLKASAVPAPAMAAPGPMVALVSVPELISAPMSPTPPAEVRPAPTAAPTAVPTETPTAMPTASVAAVPVISLHPPPPASPVGATPADQAHNDLIQGLVDRLQVSGVRAAGAGSKALVDGHVYRVNDVLDRATGLRLVRVDPDQLTFVDSEGVTYVKTF